VKVPHDADVKQRFLNVGNEVVASSAEALAAAIKREMTTLGKVIKDAGIRARVGH
jgi:tripartite-type tricarboxylate transporter receptor subunit TctC